MDAATRTVVVWDNAAGIAYATRQARAVGLQSSLDILNAGINEQEGSLPSHRDFQLSLWWTDSGVIGPNRRKYAVGV